MLADWYFTSCLRYSPRATATLLGLFDALDTAVASPEEALLALRELEQAEVWPRVYCVPKILRAARFSDNEALRRAAHQFFSGERFPLPSATRTELLAIAEKVVWEGGSSADLKTANALATASVAQRAQEPETLPYLELQHFASETLLLGCIAEMTEDEQVCRLLVTAEDDDDSGCADVLALLASAMEGRFGRLALRQAAQILARIYPGTASQLAVEIWQVRGAVPLLEPDLIEISVDLMCGSTEPDFAEKAGLLCRNELLSFVRFRKLRDALPRRQRHDTMAVFARLGLSNWPDQRDPLAIALVLWHIGLWRILSSLNAEKLLSAIKDVWTAGWLLKSGLSFQQPLPVYRVGSDPEPGPWMNCLQALASIRSEQETRYAFRHIGAASSAYGLFRDCVQSYLLSPWFERTGPGRTRDAQADGLFAQDALGLLRLFAGSWLAVRALAATVPGTVPDGRQVALDLLLHQEHTLRQQFHQWMSSAACEVAPNKPLPPGRQLPSPLTGLALFVRVQADELLRGRSGKVTLEEVFSEIGDGETAQWIATSLVPWIADLAPAFSSEPLASDWLAKVPQLASWIDKDERRLRQNCTLMLRFFHPRDRGARPLPEDFWWQRKLRGGERYNLGVWDVLIAPPPGWQDWLHLDAAVHTKRFWGAVRLASAVERAIAIDNLCPIETRSTWMDQLSTLLGIVFEDGDLDRYLQFRMLALLDAPLVLDHVKIPKQVVRTIVQTGRPAHLHRLGERLMAAPPSGVDGGLWRDLRRLFVFGLEARLTIRNRRSSEPTSLRELRRRVLERRCYTNWIGRSLLGAESMIETGELAALRREFLLLPRFRMGFGKHPAAIVLGALDIEKGALHVEEKPRHGWPDQRLLMQAIEDPDIGDFQLAYRPFVRPQENSRLGFVLGGGVLDEEGQWHSQVYLSGTGGEAPVGTPILLALNGYGEASEARVAPLPIGDGEWIEISVVRKRQQSLAGGILILRASRLPGLIEEWDTDFWDPDLSRAYWDEGPGSSSAWAVFNGQEWRPIAADVGALVARYARGHNLCITLCFVGIANEDSIAVGWYFCVEPGALYELSPADFLPEHGARLMAEIAAAEPNASGLLVTVEASLQGAAVRLVLRQDPWVDAPHPELSCPFDDRNLRWRRQFTVDDVLEADRTSENSWQLPVPRVSGFPERLQVAWESRYPREGEDRVEVIVGHTSEEQLRTGEMSARWVESIGLNLEDFQPAELYDFIQTLDEGDEIPLWRSLASEPNVYDPLVCLTRQGLRVPVALESLTFIPNSAGEALAARVSRRFARITFRRWDETLERVEVNIPSDLVEKLPTGRHEGVIAKVPRSNAGGDACQVLFRVAETTEVFLVRISQSQRLGPIQAGTRLVIEKKKSKLTASLQRLRLHAVALWQVEQTADLELDAVYLGDVQWERTQHWVCESAKTPGVLLLVSPSGMCPSHLAVWKRQNGWKRGLPSDVTYKDQKSGKPFCYFDGKRRLFRSLFATVDKRNDLLLAGWCTTLLHGGQARIRHVTIRLKANVNSTLVEISREFALTAAPAPVNVGEPAAISDDARETILERLASTVQECVVQGTGATAKAALLVRQLSRRDATFPVAETGTALVSGASYSSEGRTVLSKTLGRWMADFRAVPPMSLEIFREHLRAALEQRIDLHTFYFVGPAEGVGAGPDPLAWLFEFGYGFTLRVETARLRHNRGEFDLRGALFLGDRVKTFSFVEAVIGDASLLCLNIVDVAFQSAPATVLFHQARRQVVHVLRVSHEETGPKILSIEGCDERHLAMFANYSIAGARLRQRIPSGESSGKLSEKHEVIYGRLDTEAFSRSHGHCVEFDNVRLTFDAPGGLHDGDIVFLKATTIEETPTRNDVFLRFAPLPGLDACDIGEDFLHGVQVMRREFSGREALLRRQYGVDPDAIHDVFPVRLRAPEHRGEIRGSLMQSIPDRQTIALHDHLRMTGEPTFGVVLKRLRSRYATGELVYSLRVEFRPGIFFHLASGELAGGSARLREGTVVRITHPNDSSDKFLLLPCSFSDEVYFGNGPRPVVALPLNSLLHAIAKPEHAITDDDWWHSSHPERMFSIGDFPSTKCSLARSSDGGLFSLSAEDSIRFMSQRHPKIAWRTRGENGKSLLLPDEGTALVGALSVKSDWTIAFSPFDSSLAAETLFWKDVTYADQPIVELVARSSERTWSYHDQQTGYWDQRRYVRHQLEPNSAIRGPVFFERDSHSGLLRLRHRPDRLRDFGVPLREPVEVFGKEAVTLAVAGWAKVEGEVSGLWLELAPGRILHMPAELLCWPSRFRRFSLGRLDWLHFAPGDEITLRAVEGQVLSPDSLEFVSWQRGPRACFGRGPVLMPVLNLDRETGGLKLGAGRFQLTLPSTQAPNANAYWLWSDNGTKEFDGGFKPDDVVLLGIDESSNTVVVLGSGGCTGEPVRQSDGGGEGDSRFFNVMFRTNGAGVNWDALKTLIRRVGGAIPVTVEHFDATCHRVYFSFREQTSTIHAGRLALATPIGFFPRGSVFDEDQIVIRLGCGFLCWPFREIVPGVPSRLHATVAEELIVARTGIWMHAGDSGRLHLGYGAEPPSGEVLVSSEVVVGNLDSNREWGLVARSEQSGQLYWVPSTFLSWAEFSRREAGEFFTNSRRAIRAKLRTAQFGESFLSLVDTMEAHAEALTLLPGSETRVILRKELANTTEDTRVFQAETLASGLLIRCVMPNTRRYVLHELEAVEVERRAGGQRWSPLRLLVVDKGRRLHRLALPVHWLGGVLRQPGLSEMLTWMEEASTQTWTREETACKTSEPWERRLCHAVTWVERDPRGTTGVHELAEGRALLEKQSEIHVLPSLLVLLGLLDVTIAAPAFRREEAVAQVVEVAHAIFRRAVRSLHLEIGFRHGLGASAPAHEDIATPMGSIHNLLSSALNPENIGAIHRWATFAEISLDPSLQAVAYSLRCATGAFPGLTLGFDDGTILGQIVATCRCLDANRREGSQFIPTQALHALRKQVHSLIEAVQLQRCDLPLLPPLPAVVHFGRRDIEASNC